MNVLEEISNAFKEMVQTEPPARYAAAEREVACSHCGGKAFTKYRVLVRGPLAHCLVCHECGLAIWFERSPERLQAG